MQNTPQIILNSGIEPSNEKQVKDKVKEVLGYYFYDVVREMPIQKSVKTFKPDIGIKSLSLAIEYKFADSKEEVKTIISGINDDIVGYSRNMEWKKFFAVIYQTNMYFNAGQIENFYKKECLVPENWEFILVHGVGERKRRENS